MNERYVLGFCRTGNAWKSRVVEIVVGFERLLVLGSLRTIHVLDVLYMFSLTVGAAKYYNIALVYAVLFRARHGCARVRCQVLKS